MTPEQIAQLQCRGVDLHEAYQMGRDCAERGADTTNCHFSIFNSREKTEAWERGKRDAEKEKG